MAVSSLIDKVVETSASSRYDIHHMAYMRVSIKIQLLKYLTDFLSFAYSRYLYVYQVSVFSYEIKRLFDINFKKVTTMASNKKNKRTHLSIAERVTILNRLDNGEKAANLAKEYKITQAAISLIKKAKKLILRQHSILLESQGSTAKKRFTVEDNRLEKSLYKWFIEKTNMGDTVTGPMLQKKAVELNAELNGFSTFKGSPGFVNKFKKRHNIKCLTTHPADKKASDQFCQDLANYINETKTPLDKIYNADKTDLFWRMLPSKLPITNDEKQPFEKKLYKDRVALMMCTNATGSHKLPILVIGKNNQSHCFNNIQLPVFYEQQQNATLDSKLMLKWYKDIFLPEIEQHHGSNDQQCLLLLENAPCQLSVEQFNTISQRCRVMFLPPNVKSLVQPVNQGIIAKCKQIYKSDFLRIMFTENTFEGVKRVSKSFDLLRCCYLISKAWDSITDNFIREAWKNIVPEHAHSEPQCVKDHKDSQIENTLTYGNNEFTSKEIIAWLHNDDDELERAVLNIQEASSLENNKGTVEIENTENETEHNDYLNKHEITARDAVLAINTIIDYVNQTEDSSKNCDCLFKLWLRAIKELQNT